MKKSKTILFNSFIIVLVAITGISGCKKDGDKCTDGIQNQNETGVDCGGDCNACTASAFRIKTVTRNDGTNTVTNTYTYDNKGRITSDINTGGAANITYTYGTNSVTATFSSTGLTYNYTLNASGYATSNEIKDNSGATLISTTYGYDSEGHLITLNGNPSGTWTNGNLTYENNMGGTTFTYLTQNNTIGNENTGQIFLGKSSKNLVATKTVSLGSFVTTYTYEYDSENRVTKKTETYTSGSPNQVYTYTYY